MFFMFTTRYVITNTLDRIHVSSEISQKLQQVIEMSPKVIEDIRCCITVHSYHVLHFPKTRHACYLQKILLWNFYKSSQLSKREKYKGNFLKHCIEVKTNKVVIKISQGSLVTQKLFGGLTIISFSYKYIRCKCICAKIMKTD